MFLCSVGTGAASKEAAAGSDRYGDGAAAVRPFMKFKLVDRPDWWWTVELDLKCAFQILAPLDVYNEFVGVKGAVSGLSATVICR